MSDIATIDQQAPATASKPVKAARIPRRIREVTRLLADGTCRTVKDAAEKTGMNANYLYGALRKPEIQAFMAQRAAENISRGVLRASARYVELIDAASEHVGARVSERFLEHGGIIKPQSGGNSVNVSINNNIAAGYVVDLAGEANHAITAEPANPLEIHGTVSETADKSR